MNVRINAAGLKDRATAERLIAEAAELAVVSGEEDLVIPSDTYGDDIVCVGLLRVKIKDENQTAALIGKHVVVLPQ